MLVRNNHIAAMCVDFMLNNRTVLQPISGCRRICRSSRRAIHAHHWDPVAPVTAVCSAAAINIVAHMWRSPICCFAA